MALRNFTNEYLDSRFMERFLRASYDERRGVLRMLHAAHEGLEQGDFEVVSAVPDDIRALIAESRTPEPVEFEAEYRRLEAQAKAEMQPA